MDEALHLDDWLGQRITVVMDRPLGTKHPQWGFVYELNYGYVPGTLAPDGEPIDVYVLGATEPLEHCEAEVIAIIRRRDDVEDKLVATVAGVWTAEAVSDATNFQEQFFDSWVEWPEQTH